MKVLQLILTQRFYGAERVVYNLSKGLIDEGTEVVIVTTTGLSEKFSELPASRIYILSMSDTTRLSERVFAYTKWIDQLRFIVSTDKPDVLHVHGTLARYLALMENPACPVIETLHYPGLRKDEASERVIHSVSDKLAAISFEGTIFFDYALLKDYSRLRLLRPSVVIYNPVDEDFVRMISVPMEPPIKGKYILWCGRLTRIKGADMLLRAFAQLKRLDICLVLLSDGPDRQYLENLARSLGIQESTIFLGFVDETRKAQFFQHASIICVNLTNPGLSQAVMEAAVTGNPVVTGYAQRISELFGPYLGLLRTRSVDELAFLLSAKLDADEEDLAASRRILQEKFSLSRFTQEHLAFYEQILRATPKNPHFSPT